MSTAVATVKAHSDKYECFGAIVMFLTQHIDKQEPTPSMVASITQARLAKQQKTSATHGTFKGKIVEVFP